MNKNVGAIALLLLHDENLRFTGSDTNLHWCVRDCMCVCMCVCVNISGHMSVNTCAGVCLRVYVYL